VSKIFDSEPNKRPLAAFGGVLGRDGGARRRTRRPRRRKIEHFVMAVTASRRAVVATLMPLNSTVTKTRKGNDYEHERDAEEMQMRIGDFDGDGARR
jgi:hypothetical protein